MVAMYRNPAEDLAGQIISYTTTQDATSPGNELLKQREFTDAFNQLTQNEKNHFLQFYGKFAPLVGQENQGEQMLQMQTGFSQRPRGFLPKPGPNEMQIEQLGVSMPRDVKTPGYGTRMSTGIPGQALRQMGGIANIANLQRRLQPPMQQQGGPSLMARLENVDNNVQQIARQLGVQNQPPRPNLPSAMQTMQGPPRGIAALLQQRQQQVAQADPLLLQQNQLAAQSRLQPRYNPQAQMLMQQQAVPSQALQALQSRRAYRGLAAGPFAFSMRR